MKHLFKSLRGKLKRTGGAAAALILDRRGELATNTIGGIIVAGVIIGLLIVAINSFFPGFFTSMFNSMANKLNANW
jgi:hypothetical protein